MYKKLDSHVLWLKFFEIFDSRILNPKKCDLSAEIWDICEERKEEVENEGFKMVFELSKEIDSLKENIQEHNYEITTCKVKY